MIRGRQEVLEYFREANRVLREKIGRPRILLNDNEKHRLAIKGKTTGGEPLRQFGTLFSPCTILRRRRMLVCRRYSYRDGRRPGPVPPGADPAA
jgi:hypothetical protein